jgi:gliding motility-associated lipoprotein GldH
MPYNIFAIMRWILPVVLTLCLSACLHNDVFEKNNSLPNRQWSLKEPQSFVFTINDTLSNYMVYATLRHTDAYPFSNIWLNVATTLPGETIPLSSNVELTLAQADGKWLGRGMQDIREHQIPLTPQGSPVHFSKTGTYTMTLKHLMRQDPLPELMSIGVRLEKIKKQ